MANTIVILCAGKLRSKNTGAGKSAEDTEVENKQQLIDDGHSRHLKRADTANHHIIKQTDDVGYRILNDNRQNDCNHLPVKSTVADKCTAESRPHRIL